MGTCPGFQHLASVSGVGADGIQMEGGNINCIELLKMGKRRKKESEGELSTAAVLEA